FTYASGKFPLSADDNSLWMDFGDLNHDGRLDAVTGQGESSGPDKVFLANTNMAVDMQAPTIILVEQVGAADGTVTPALRYAVSDAVVTDTGPRLQRAYVKVQTASMEEIEAWFSGGDIFRAVLPAFPEGTDVSYTACAVDVQGNEGCAQPLSYTVGRTPTGSGGAGGAGAGGGPSSSGPGAATSGAGGSGAGDEGDDGCGCVVPGRAPDGSAWWLLGLAALVRRRIRRAR